MNIRDVQNNIYVSPFYFPKYFSNVTKNVSPQENILMIWLASMIEYILQACTDDQAEGKTEKVSVLTKLPF